MNIFKKEKGFTLVELIIVISIIAILGAIGLSSYTNVSRNARNAKRKADLKELKTAIESYYAQNGSYPSTNGAWRCITGCGYEQANDNIPGWIPGLVAGGFIDRLPHDPRELQVNPVSGSNGCRTTASANAYLYNSNGTDYKLLAHCTPENPFTGNDPVDPVRPDYSWAVFSSGARTW